VSVDLRLTATASAQARTVAEAGTLNSAFRGASFLDGWHPDKSRRRLPDSEPAMLKSGLIERIAERNPHLYQQDVDGRPRRAGQAQGATVPHMLICSPELQSGLIWLFNDEQVEPLTAQRPQALQIRHEATQRPVPRFCGGRQGREDKRPSPPTE